MKKHLRAYYVYCAHHLQRFLPNVPELKITAAKGYMGQAYRDNTGFVYRIALSAHNLDWGRWEAEQEDIDELIETICHELAHVVIFDHSTEHTELTAGFAEYIKLALELDVMDEYEREAV